MVIRPGGSYGRPVEVQPSWPRCDRDAEVGAHIARRGAEPCVLQGGDLLTTLGGGSTHAAGTASAYPVDALRVVLDHAEEHLAAAHVVVRAVWWGGECAVAMNAAWLGSWYLGPRAHPNDGLVDVTIGRLPWQQRLLAWRRAQTGTHLPHPALRTVRRPIWDHTFPVATPTYVDGRRVGRVRHLHIVVVPDAGVVVA